MDYLHAISHTAMAPVHILSRRDLPSQPASFRTRLDDHPTLLVSWWCTGFALVIILLRLWGRWLRTETLFREDTIMALSIIPLLARMAFADGVLLYGTNNVVTTGLTQQQIDGREIGSRLVLGARVFYALFIWTAKFTVSEYLKRLAQNIWTPRYEIMLRAIRGFLVVTFIGVVIATLAECQPFDHYWQVVPDPGVHCRDGYAQLLTMSICDIITDLLLVVFPIPILMKSQMPLQRRLSLSALFSLNIVLIAIAGWRMAAIIRKDSSQQTRTLWASIEILFSSAVSNALIIGSFLRDRGVRKNKYKKDTTERSDSAVAAPRQVEPSINRVMTKQHWGNDSDEDLFAHVRGRMQSAPAEDAIAAVAKPPPPAVMPAEKVSQPSGSRWSISEQGGTTLAPIRAPTKSSSQNRHYSEGEELELYDIGGVLETGDSHDSGPGPSPGTNPDNYLDNYPAGSRGPNPSEDATSESPPIAASSRQQHPPQTSQPPGSGRLGLVSTVDFADVGGLIGASSTPGSAGAAAAPLKPDSAHTADRADGRRQAAPTERAADFPTFSNSFTGGNAPTFKSSNASLKVQSQSPRPSSSRSQERDRNTPSPSPSFQFHTPSRSLSHRRGPSDSSLNRSYNRDTNALSDVVESPLHSNPTSKVYDDA